MVHRRRPVFLPTGAGQSKAVPTGNIRFLERGSWFPDSRRVLLAGREPNHRVRTYIAALDGGMPQPLTPEGLVGVLLSPAGDTVLVRVQTGNWLLFRIGDGTTLPVKGLGLDLAPVAWSSSPDILYARGGEMPARIHRVNLRSGTSEVWRDLMPVDPAGGRSTQDAPIDLG